MRTLSSVGPSQPVFSDPQTDLNQPTVRQILTRTRVAHAAGIDPLTQGRSQASALEVRSFRLSLLLLLSLHVGLRLDLHVRLLGVLLLNLLVLRLLLRLKLGLRLRLFVQGWLYFVVPSASSLSPRTISL